MSSDNNSGRNGGIGFCGLLAILFIALKLTHVINWSWLWVLCPIWIPIALVIVIFVIIGFCSYAESLKEGNKGD